MELIERLKALVEEKAGSKKLFSEMIGVPQTSFNTYLTKGRIPPSDILIQIVERFPDVSAEWLLRGEGNMIKSFQREDVISIDMRKQKSGDFSPMDNGVVNIGDAEAVNKLKALSIVEKIVNNKNASQDSIDRAISILEKLV